MLRTPFYWKTFFNLWSGCPEAFSFKNLSDFTPFLDDLVRLRERPYRAGGSKTWKKNGKLNNPA